MSLFYLYRVTSFYRTRGSCYLRRQHCSKWYSTLLQSPTYAQMSAIFNLFSRFLGVFCSRISKVSKAQLVQPVMSRILARLLRQRALLGSLRSIFSQMALEAKYSSSWSRQMAKFQRISTSSPLARLLALQKYCKAISCYLLPKQDYPSSLQSQADSSPSTISSNEAMAASNCPILWDSFPIDIKYSRFLSREHKVLCSYFIMFKADWQLSMALGYSVFFSYIRASLAQASDVFLRLRASLQLSRAQMQDYLLARQSPILIYDSQFYCESSAVWQVRIALSKSPSTDSYILPNRAKALRLAGSISRTLFNSSMACFDEISLIIDATSMREGTQSGLMLRAPLNELQAQGRFASSRQSIPRYCLMYSVLLTLSIYVTISIAYLINPCFYNIPAVIMSVSIELGFFLRMLWAKFNALFIVSSLKEQPQTNLFSIQRSDLLIQSAFYRFSIPAYTFPSLSNRLPSLKKVSAELNLVHLKQVLSASSYLCCVSNNFPIASKINCFSAYPLNCLQSAVSFLQASSKLPCFYRLTAYASFYWITGEGSAEMVLMCGLKNIYKVQAGLMGAVFSPKFPNSIFSKPVSWKVEATGSQGAVYFVSFSGGSQVLISSFLGDYPALTLFYSL